MSTGRKWAYAGTFVGGFSSMFGNISHTVISGHVSIGALFFAGLWPVTLFIALEIMTKVDWPDTPVWAFVQWLGLGPIALVSFVISWHHMYRLMLHFGEPEPSAILGPLVFDGLMLLSAAALLIQPSLKRARKRSAAVAATSPAPAPVKAKTFPKSERDAVRIAYEQSIMNGAPLSVEEISARLGISKDAAASQRKRWNKSIPLATKN